MHSKLLKSAFSVIIILAFAIQAIGQGVSPHLNPKYGTDSSSRVHCAMNISLYSEFYKQKNYNDAVNSWRKVFNNCPKASKNTYIKGANIYNNLIIREKDKTKKEALIDTLMMIYDQRIEYFGGKGRVYSYKGIDLYGYRGNTAEQEVYDILGEAMKLEDNKSKSAVVTIYMQCAVSLYKATPSKIEGSQIINDYTFSIETLEKATEYNKILVSKGGKYQKRGEKELKNIETSFNNVEALFSESGAATCDALIAIFEPKCSEKSEDLEWMKKVNKLLNRAECTEHDLYARTAEQQYKLEPSAEAAHNLARLFLKREEYKKAAGYYDEATKLQENAGKKALYYYEWSQLAYAMENLPKVRKLSNKALEFNPNDGKPYIMIGKAYAASKKMKIGEESVEHYSVYWVAVDNFYKAKKVDAELTEKANNLIATYTKHFPKYEEWFMAVGSNEGDSYTVGGWINVKTKVRF